MSRTETCQSCGSKLAPNQPRPKGRVCSACHKQNPEGFSYCGFCASPMETTEHRARILELAAPPGGWPSLTSELVEVRFYLQQGLFDDAYELLSILQRRHPGHPQLVDLARKPKAATRVDTDVLALVDAVLADSVNLASKIPRRQAPKWHAPSTPGPDRTQAHTTVSSKSGEDKPKTPVKSSKAASRDSGKHASTSKQKHTVKTGGQKTTATPQRPSPTATKTKSGAQKSTSTTGRRPIAAAPPRGRTELYKVGDAPLSASAKAPPNSGHTVVVDALQPATPFEPIVEAVEPASSKRAAKPGRKRPPEEAAPAPEPAATEGESPKKRRVSFGEHVLNRLR